MKKTPCLFLFVFLVSLVFLVFFQGRRLFEKKKHPNHQKKRVEEKKSISPLPSPLFCSLGHPSFFLFLFSPFFSLFASCEEKRKKCFFFLVFQIAPFLTEEKWKEREKKNWSFLFKRRNGNFLRERKKLTHSQKKRPFFSCSIAQTVFLTKIASFCFTSQKKRNQKENIGGNES